MPAPTFEDCPDASKGRPLGRHLDIQLEQCTHHKRHDGHSKGNGGDTKANTITLVLLDTHDNSRGNLQGTSQHTAALCCHRRMVTILCHTAAAKQHLLSRLSTQQNVLSRHIILPHSTVPTPQACALNQTLQVATQPDVEGPLVSLVLCAWSLTREPMLTDA
jgi:hypothetical protein